MCDRRHLSRAFRVGIAGFVIAVLGQAIVGVLLACLEFVGLGEAQRILLRASEAVYGPGIGLFYAITPGGWSGVGNVLLGLLSVIFAGLVYALGIGVLCGMFLAVVGSKSATSRAKAYADR